MALPAGGEELISRPQDSTSVTSILDGLSRMTPKERAAFFRKTFLKTVQPMRDIGPPPLCDIYPDFARDIIDAYFHYTTFTARIWVNYDASCKRFYVDQRTQGCGKLVRSAHQSLIQGLKKQNVELSRVDLEVGTAFSTLCHIELRSQASTGQVIARCKPDTGHHPDLINFLRDISAHLETCNISGQHGFTMADLEQTAALLLREPDSNDVDRWGRLHWDAPWMSSPDAIKAWMNRV